jgi:hypothetical protein
MDYQQKYLKYKQKYLDLKKEMNGGMQCDARDPRSREIFGFWQAVSRNLQRIKLTYQKEIKINAGNRSCNLYVWRIPNPMDTHVDTFVRDNNTIGFSVKKRGVHFRLEYGDASINIYNVDETNARNVAEHINMLHEKYLDFY